MLRDCEGSVRLEEDEENSSEHISNERCWEIILSFDLTNGFNSTLDGKSENHHSNWNKQNREQRKKDQLIFQCAQPLILFRLKLSWEVFWVRLRDEWKKVANHLLHPKCWKWSETGWCYKYHSHILLQLILFSIVWFLIVFSLVLFVKA